MDYLVIQDKLTRDQALHLAHFLNGGNLNRYKGEVDVRMFDQGGI